MFTSALRIIILLAGGWNAHLCSTSHYCFSRSMECLPFLYESLLSEQEHGMLTSALRVITLLVGAWNANLCSTNLYSLSRSMEYSPLLYESLLS
jgi:hypothetical protein